MSNKEGRTERMIRMAEIKAWNEAIEAAAREAELFMDETVPRRIRDLKK